MLVSTMDGKVAALDVQNAGKVQWNMNAGTGPLLSSSITKLEVCSFYNFLGINFCNSPDFTKCECKCMDWLSVVTQHYLSTKPEACLLYNSLFTIDLSHL